MYTVIGVLAALRACEQTGQGQVLDQSLLEGQAAYLTVLAADYFATGQPPRPAGNAHQGIVPYQVFHTADKDVIIAVGSERQWEQFCAVLGLGPEVRDDQRFATNPARLQHRSLLVPLLQARLASRPAAEVLNQLRAAEIPCGPINTVPDTLADEHYRARGNLVALDHPAAGPVTTLANPIRLADAPAAYRLPPPTLGQHTGAILAEIGYTEEAVTALRSAGVIG
jgi:crotonobetainyl-CoA:carnitine CoA-transferase CaiB-like acyl-CoA transferase